MLKECGLNSFYFFLFRLAGSNAREAPSRPPPPQFTPSAGSAPMTPMAPMAAAAASPPHMPVPGQYPGKLLSALLSIFDRIRFDCVK